VADLDSVGPQKTASSMEGSALPPVETRPGRWRPIICALAILAGVALAWTFGVYDYLRLENLARLQRWVNGLGAWAPILFMAAYVILELLFVPALPLTILAGIAFGPLWGTVYTWIAATVSAALAFLITRHGGREMVERWIAGHPRLARIDEAVARHGWYILAFTRLVPVFPFNLQNYAYGLTGLRFSTYLLVTAVFMIPGTAALVIAGDALVVGDADLGWLVAYLAVAGVLLGLLYVIPHRLGARRGVTDQLNRSE
jgi:uncharacterized membrane protein YdjX (TVP38/TMEM64 family)